LTSIQVNDVDNIPQGFVTETFETSLCVKFRYVGKFHYYELNRNSARHLYSAIWNFFTSDQSGYILTDEMLRFEKVDTRHYDGTHCQMEWFAPILEKSKNVRKCLSLPGYYYKS
jgi:AraC family transcriptional regulator